LLADPYNHQGKNAGRHPTKQGRLDWRKKVTNEKLTMTKGDFIFDLPKLTQKVKRRGQKKKQGRRRRSVGVPYERKTLVTSK